MGSVAGMIFAAVAVIGIGYATYRAPRLTSVLFWAMVATVFLSAGLILLLPGEIRARVFWLGMLLPVIWVMLQLWCYFDERHWRVVIGLLGLTGFGASCVFLLAPAT